MDHHRDALWKSFPKSVLVEPKYHKVLRCHIISKGRSPVWRSARYACPGSLGDVHIDVLEQIRASCDTECCDLSYIPECPPIVPIQDVQLKAPNAVPDASKRPTVAPSVKRRTGLHTSSFARIRHTAMIKNLSIVSCSEPMVAGRRMPTLRYHGATAFSTYHQHPLPKALAFH